MKSQWSLVVLLMLLASCNKRNAPSPFQGAIDTINAQAPDAYPELVTPIPSTQEFRSMSTGDLIDLLDSWNPPLRLAVSEVLSHRGAVVIPELVEATRSDNWRVRAGASSALTAIFNELTRHWQKHFPQMESRDAAQAYLNKNYPDVAEAFIRLAQDQEREVRFTVASGIGALAPSTPEAARALMRLWSDEDEFIVQEAMIAFGRELDPGVVPPQEVVDAIRPVFQSELPRSRGYAARIIAQVDEPYQRQLIPELLDHLTWEPIRDTMFIQIGPEDSIAILTKLRVPELVPLLPELMFKRMHGHSIYIPCLRAIRAYGVAAKDLLPTLQKQAADIEAHGRRSAYAPRRDYEESLSELRKTISHLESL